MKPFVYLQPKRLNELRKVTGFQPNVSSPKIFLAGGTNVVDLLKKGILTPDELWQVENILPKDISWKNNILSIGANASNSEVAEHTTVLEKFPLLSKAILAGASPQIRNMATVGGNLFQKTRCPYFYQPEEPCNKRKPGSGCAGRQGEQKMLAIIGYSESCAAVHPSDMCIALAALEAEVLYVTPNDRVQKIKFQDLHKLPGNNPETDHHLPAGALVQQILLSDTRFAQHSAYVKLRDRDSYAFALVSTAAAFQMKDGKIEAARLASGGVAPKPWRWTAAENFLIGKEPQLSVFEQAADLVSKAVKPLPNNQFKVPMLKASVVNALAQALS